MLVIIQKKKPEKMIWTEANVFLSFRFSRWKWFRHVYRKQGIVRDMPRCVASGSSSRGRPRETWIRTIRREAEEECWDDLDKLAQDRA